MSSEEFSGCSVEGSDSSIDEALGEWRSSGVVLCGSLSDDSAEVTGESDSLVTSEALVVPLSAVFVCSDLDEAELSEFSLDAADLVDEDSSPSFEEGDEVAVGLLESSCDVLDSEFAAGELSGATRLILESIAAVASEPADVWLEVLLCDATSSSPLLICIGV